MGAPSGGSRPSGLGDRHDLVADRDRSRARRGAWGGANAECDGVVSGSRHRAGHRDPPDGRHGAPDAAILSWAATAGRVALLDDVERPGAAIRAEQQLGAAYRVAASGLIEP